MAIWHAAACIRGSEKRPCCACLRSWLPPHHCPYRRQANSNINTMEILRETLARAPAVHQLQHGCARLGLHPDVALELVCFLHLKRRYVPESGNQEPEGLSPGTQLDQLWHWMLLNTKVAKEVHALIGGEVEHASTDEEDLSDDTKVLRRLAALNLLAGKGWTPTLAFWEEPGTMLHTLEHVAYGPHHLYVHPGASHALCGPLARLVRRADARLLPAGDLWGAAAPGAAGVVEQAVPVPACHQAGDDLEEVQEMEEMNHQLYPPRAVTLVFHPNPQQVLPNLAAAVVSVPCEPYATLGDLYTGAAWYLSPHQDPTQPELAVAAGQLRLVHRSRVLEEHGSTLLGAELQDGDVVHVLQPGQHLPVHFNIHIKTLTGQIIMVCAHTQMLVLEVKQLVEVLEGNPRHQQRLICAGRQLEDMRRLADYQIKKDSVLHLVVRLGGC